MPIRLQSHPPSWKTNRPIFSPFPDSDRAAVCRIPPFFLLPSYFLSLPPSFQLTLPVFTTRVDNPKTRSFVLQPPPGEAPTPRDQYDVHYSQHLKRFRTYPAGGAQQICSENFPGRSQSETIFERREINFKNRSSRRQRAVRTQMAHDRSSSGFL